jgi:putative toxin-antitoxin system antitoxin component (TIGR02293 family)
MPAARTQENPAPTVTENRAPFLHRLSDLLGLEKPMRAERDIASVVQARIAPHVIDILANEGLTSKELAVVLPPRTLSHRRAKGESLSLEETDRAVRVARIMALAEGVFGDKEKAMRWLRKTPRRFEGRTPLAMLATEAGGRLVEQALIQIDEGYSA